MNRYTFQIVALLIASGISLAACAQTGAEKPAVDRDLRGSDCILIRTIRDYTPLDDRHLLVYGPGKRAYFVTLFRPAFGMRSTFTLGFSSRDDQLCPFGGDSIILDGIGHDDVGIRSISRISKEQVEELKIRYGKKKPPAPDATEPAEVQGAEVEELD